MCVSVCVCVCVCVQEITRIRGIGTDRRDRRDARDRTDRKKLKNGRGLGYNWKLGNWEFEIGKLKIDFQGKLKIRWIYPDGWLAGRRGEF